MCGIAGIINLEGRLSPDKLKQIVRAMADSMTHRGPDDSGVWVDPSGYCALSHRRLSIIDTSSAGRQPMASSDGRFHITFNGEIYNYQELKPELLQKGSCFSTQTDTEVLIEAVRQFGRQVFEKLDGMYAFALYDSETRKTVLARDAFGEKPLYYSLSGGILAFSSELHAFCHLPGFDTTLDEDGLAQYLLFQYIPPPRTIYRSISKLPPGCWMEIDENSKITIRRHFSFRPAEYPDKMQPLDALADELEEILVRSIRRRMISDVPLGAFLSGGVDSSAVVALMTQRLNRHVKTFTLGCHDTDDSEHIQARQIAEHLGADHNELVLRPDVPRLINTIAACIDEPNADSSCLPTYLLSQYSRSQVTVLLSGDGGDEMFGGYNRYFATMREEESAISGDPAFAKWQPGSAYLSSRILIFTPAELEQLLGSIPPETKDLLNGLRSSLNDGGLPLLSRLRQLDLHNYMPGAVLSKVDRMSMQHALEVRCPILSVEVARFAEKLATSHCYGSGQGKLVLKEVAARYLPRAWLDRRKMGFGIATDLWKKEDFISALRTQLLGRRTRMSKWIDRKRLEAFVARQQGSAFSPYHVWAVMLLEIWLKNHRISPAKFGQSKHDMSIFSDGGHLHRPDGPASGMHQ